MKHDDNCIFCKIGQHQIKSNIVYEDEVCMAFLDISPVSRGHTLLICKEHFPTLLHLPKNILDHMFEVTQKLSKIIMDSLDASGVNILNNCGEAAGQEVQHFHIHIIPRYAKDKRKVITLSPYQIEDREYLMIANSIKDKVNN